MGGLEVGALLFAFSLAAVLGYLLSGALADRLGLSRVLLAASLGFALGPLLLALWPQMPLPLLYLVYLLMGFTGAFNILSLAQARLSFPTALTGRAVTAINFLGFIGVFLLQWGLGWRWPGGTAPPCSCGAGSSSWPFWATFPLVRERPL